MVGDFDADGVDDLAIPSADRRSLRLIKFSGKADSEKILEEIASVRLPGEISRALSIQVKDGKPVITVGLKDGSTWAVHQ